MTDRSVPFNLGKGTCLRFTRADIKAIENALGIGYPHFTDRSILGSLTATEVFVWRGMKIEAPDGKLVHAYTLNSAGQEEAGEDLFAYLQGDNTALSTAITDAFLATCLWRAREPAAEKPAGETGENPKN